MTNKPEINKEEVPTFCSKKETKVTPKINESIATVEEESRKAPSFNARNKGAEIDRLNEIIKTKEELRSQEIVLLKDIHETQMDNLLIEHHRVSANFLIAKKELKRLGGK